MDMSIRFPGLNIELDYVGKSFNVFGFEITIYGILIAVGILLGIGFIVLEARRNHEDQDKYLNMIIISLVAAVIGARLFYVAFSWSLYKGNLMEIFNMRNGGSAFYGGLLGGVLAAAVFCRICKLSFWKMADTVCMGILIGQMIGRWGNFFNRESFGEYTDIPLAMQLPLSAVRSGEVTTSMRENLITEGGVSWIQVHPVFLYESAWCLLLFLILMVIRRRKRFQGEIFVRYLAGYGLGRFFFEWLRTDQLYIPGTKIGISLVISAALFLILTPIVIVRRIMTKKRAAARKRRREKEYEAQENAYREMTAKEEEKKTKTEEEGTISPKTETETTDAKETPEERQQTEPEPETENWETSEYAHIPQRWRDNEHVLEEQADSAEKEPEKEEGASEDTSASEGAGQ